MTHNAVLLNLLLIFSNMNLNTVLSAQDPANANHTPAEKSGVLAHFQQSKIAKTLEGIGAAALLTGCLEGGSTASIPAINAAPTATVSTPIATQVTAIAVPVALRNPDIIAPTVTTFVDAKGKPIAFDQATQTYQMTITTGTIAQYEFSTTEKVNVTYTMKDASGNNVIATFPIIVTPIASTANLGYSLEITAPNSLSNSQTTVTVNLQITLADAANNKTAVNGTVKATDPVALASAVAAASAVTAASAVVAPVAPTLPANLPTAFAVNGASGSIDLTPYIPAGASLVLVSVADPSNGVLGGVGGPNASVSGGIVSISVPTFYGTSNIPMTLKLTNSAGSSPDFVVTANGMSN